MHPRCRVSGTSALERLRRPARGQLPFGARADYTPGVADLQHHLSGNVEQYVQRIKMHDDVDAPRRVEHFAEFRRYADAVAAAAALEREGWAVTVERRRLTQGRLIAAQTTTVDVETADRCTEQVFAAVAQHKGRYEGWNAPVLRSL